VRIPELSIALGWLKLQMYMSTLHRLNACEPRLDIVCRFCSEDNCFCGGCIERLRYLHESSLLNSIRHNNIEPKVGLAPMDSG
jgi:hypothetical protein